MSNDLEKDMDDEVYEDSFYADEEELVDEEEAAAFDEEESEAVSITMSYVCEDCDYRWDDLITKKPGADDDDLDVNVVCPMCGSMNVSQI